MAQLEEHVVIGDSEKKESADKLLELPLEIRALRNLQLETKEIHSEFFRKIYELEIEFQKKHEAVFQKRRDIVNGICSPRTGTESVGQQDEATPAGVPRFWSNVLSSTLFEIQKSDRPILEHLTDVRARNKPFSELGFVLEFDFSPNEYFENETLTKEYYYTCSFGGEMVHQGPQIYKSVGCEIKWKNGKTVASDSFFNFFRTKTETEETPGNDETFGMTNDFEMGYFIKERVIPRAVLFYNEHFHIDDPPLRSELSYSTCEPISPTMSMLADAGSSCMNKSTNTSLLCESSSNSGQ
ncbi:hypothetical protein HA402_003563 [Bradysia odoriphaga]|nr:hypothetical protein HA402_003563 [Bradysia odoriphaga]